jgi:hypothetical protein
MEFVFFGHYRLTPAAKKRKVFSILSIRWIFLICSPKAFKICPQDTPLW